MTSSGRTPVRAEVSIRRCQCVWRALRYFILWPCRLLSGPPLGKRLQTWMKATHYIIRVVLFVTTQRRGFPNAHGRLHKLSHFNLGVVPWPVKWCLKGYSFPSGITLGLVHLMGSDKRIMVSTIVVKTRVEMQME